MTFAVVNSKSPFTPLTWHYLVFLILPSLPIEKSHVSVQSAGASNINSLVLAFHNESHAIYVTKPNTPLIDTLGYKPHLLWGLEFKADTSILATSDSPVPSLY